MCRWCSGGNVAVGVSRFRGWAGFIGRVGNDPLGKFMREVLQAENVCTKQMILNAQHRTSTVIVGLDNGDVVYFYGKSECRPIFRNRRFTEFNQGDFLHCCSIAFD